MNLSRQAQQILRETFGFEQFRSYQRPIIDRVLDGITGQGQGHSLVIMPTGMGKSLCFQIPALVAASHFREHPVEGPKPISLVLSPLIALMKDQVDALVEKGISATFINSSLSRADRLQRYEEVQQGSYDLLYVAPERFRKAEFLEVIAQRRVVLLAIDEAHCISEWGHDFRPDYTRVGEIRKSLNALSGDHDSGRMSSPTTIALTATATPDVQRDIVRQLNLKDAEMQVFHAGIERPNLHLDVQEVWDDDDKLEAMLSIRQRHPGSGIIYFNLIRKLCEFSDRLQQAGMAHLVYHGDLNRSLRRELQETFMNEPDHLVLATNAFGMGVDKEDIRFVLHADLPSSLESYYQEIGRAGRDGEPSECRLLFDQRDLATQMEFMRWQNPDAEYYQRVHYFLREENEQVNAYGLEWLRERLHAKQKHDRRLETALAMMDRWEVTEGDLNGRGGSESLSVLGPLPAQLADAQWLDAKLKRDQLKLLTMVRYAQHDGDRKIFIDNYFLRGEIPGELPS